MGIFQRLGALLGDGAGHAVRVLASFQDLFRALCDGRARRDAAFAIAMIALSAKMAKADGVVLRSEVDAFTRLFSIPAGEEANVARFFDLAKRDVAGFESYAADIRRLFGDDPATLEDILDGLFEIAVADGAVHDRELGYLGRVGAIFGFGEDEFARIRERHVRGDAADPYLVLGADPAWSAEQLRRHYRRLVAEYHPDRLIARGVPEEFVRIATDRLAAINVAWERLQPRLRPA